MTAAKPEVEVVREAEGEGERDLPGPEAVEEAPGRTKRRGLGVRLGYSLPIGGAPAFTGGLSGGLYYRAAPKSGRLGFEFGMDCGLSESDSGAVKSTLLMGHAEAVLNLSRTGSPYVLGGGKFVVEQTSDAAYDTDDTIVGGAIDVGAGVTLSSGKVDIRALYSFLLQSENIAGVASVALGYAF